MHVHTNVWTPYRMRNTAKYRGYMYTSKEYLEFCNGTRLTKNQRNVEVQMLLGGSTQGRVGSMLVSTPPTNRNNC